MKSFEMPTERIMEYEMYSERLLTIDKKTSEQYYGYFGYIQKFVNYGKKVKKRIRKK